MSLRNITDALSACDLTLPESAQRWADLHAALQARRGTVSTEAPHEAADRLSMDNLDEVVASMTRQRVDAEAEDLVIRQLEQEAGNRAVAATTADADTVIAAARAGFDRAVQTITDHAGAFAPTDTAVDVLHRGAEASTAWGEIVRASEDLDAYTRLWQALHERPATADAVVETYDGDHWRRVDAQQMLEQPNRWHTLVAAGYKLRLNTRPESLALVRATPERELRSVVERRNGIVSATLERQ